MVKNKTNLFPQVSYILIILSSAIFYHVFDIWSFDRYKYQSQETCLILFWSSERQPATEMKWNTPVAPRQLWSTIGAQATAVIQADSSQACRATTNVWPFDLWLLENSSVGTLLPVRDCQFLRTQHVIIVAICVSRKQRDYSLQLYKLSRNETQLVMWPA